MSSASARSAQEKANLARIRDNQRRSRARRKEYLQELENRVRQCELQGIEASAEIQVAARRVSEENRKLRILLNQSGIFDDMIEHHLATTAPVDNSRGTGQAVATLEELLQPRMSCRGPPMVSSIGTLGEHDRGITRDSSVGSMSTNQSSVWDQPMASASSSSGHKRNRSIHSRNPPQSATPSNRNQSHDSNSPMNQRGNMLAPNNGYMNRPIQVQASSSMSPAINTSPIYDTMTFDFESQASNSHDSNSFYFQPPSIQSPHNNFNLSQQSHSQQASPNPLQQNETLRPHSQPPTSAANSQNPSPAVNFGTDFESNFESTLMNTSSCIFAADMIGTMAGRREEEVRAELGCASSGEDCEVSDEIVFGVMDRYN